MVQYRGAVVVLKGPGKVSVGVGGAFYANKCAVSYLVPPQGLVLWPWKEFLEG